ncbi:fibrobacter succinogenes major paralogous domain-containing protein [Candidatus Saccharibacteria bacterium]|nr:fibrobacter succinogenes major paralogous domain-containing protein [Candidatus Saccharibacteria bacterium]
MAFAFVGCDDSSSASAEPNDEPGMESSSSVEFGSSSSEKVKPQSSSSEKSGMSSSSVNNASSSSEKLGSSSSVGTPESSSSEKLSEASSSSAGKAKSSSSVVTLAMPCKTETEDNCEYGELTDDRDGQTYKTVKIGDQWWMAENLNFDPGQGGSDDAKYDWSWCYKDNADNCVKYGRLYTWAAAIDSVKLATDVENPLDCGYGKVCGLASADSATLIQGICPNGWHLPSETEWEKLFEVVGGQSTAGNVLKSQTGWESKNGTDAFGFSAVSAGHRNVFGAYNGNAAYFWGSTEANRYYACRMYLEYNYDNAALTRYDKFLGHSVRCVKD